MPGVELVSMQVSFLVLLFKSARTQLGIDHSNLNASSQDGEEESFMGLILEISLRNYLAKSNNSGCTSLFPPVSNPVSYVWSQI